MDLFICGTDTACGKTVVTAALALEYAPEVAVIKPVQTGFPPDDDAAWAGKVAGCPALTLERFSEPLAPAVCAEREHRPLDVGDLVERTLAVEARNRLCEAAGGLLAPLAGVATMADLAAGLGWAVVVATRPALGTLNHTALTVEVAESRGLTVAGLVVSNYGGGTLEDTNLDRLATIAPVLGVIPALDDVESELANATVWLDPVTLALRLC